MELTQSNFANKRCAVTSQNFRSITGHAGKSRRFLIYAQSTDEQWIEIDRLDLPKEMSMHEFRGNEHPLDNLDVIITGSCGAGFVRRMQSRGVEVFATSETDPLKAVMTLVEGKPLPPPLPHSH
jgi:predicted Fe-Mo cluster-binding NifX family protein